MTPQFTYEPNEDANGGVGSYDSHYVNNVQDAIWKEVSIAALTAPVVIGQTFEVFGCTFTVTGIEPHEWIALSDPHGASVEVPAWPWASAGA